MAGFVGPILFQVVPGLHFGIHCDHSYAVGLSITPCATQQRGRNQRGRPWITQGIQIYHLTGIRSTTAEQQIWYDADRLHLFMFIEWLIQWRESPSIFGAFTYTNDDAHRPHPDSTDSMVQRWNQCYSDMEAIVPFMPYLAAARWGHVFCTLQLPCHMAYRQLCLSVGQWPNISRDYGARDPLACMQNICCVNTRNTKGLTSIAASVQANLLV